MLLLNPQAASAYLDPGAGNALVYIAVTLVSVAAYAAKELFYRLTGRKNGGKAEEKYDAIAIFSEGKSYWTTFKPIVDALIARGQPFSYYTMDIEDPALTLRNPLMRRRYIGTGSAASARLNRVSCRVMFATTPNIGTPGYPISRPAKVAFLSHVFHGAEGIGSYKKGALDHYDSVCVTGDYVKPAIRYLEQKRGLPPKELVSLGLPYWDVMLKQARDCLDERQRSEKADGKKTLLLAPSWSEKGFLSCYDTGFIKSLAREYDLILRPHPQSWKSETELLDSVRRDLADIPNITWDRDSDPAHSLAVSDLMISDFSGVRMDYAVIYRKPVVSLEVGAGDVSSFELADLPEQYAGSITDKVCVVVKKEEIGNINAIVKAALESSSQDIDSFIRANIANLGTAGEHIADYLIEKSKVLSTHGD